MVLCDMHLEHLHITSIHSLQQLLHCSRGFAGPEAGTTRNCRVYVPRVTLSQEGMEDSEQMA
jgi:hypothetical protein